MGTKEEKEKTEEYIKQEKLIKDILNQNKENTANLKEQVRAWEEINKISKETGEYRGAQGLVEDAELEHARNKLDLAEREIELRKQLKIVAATMTDQEREHLDISKASLEEIYKQKGALKSALGDVGDLLEGWKTVKTTTKSSGDNIKGLNKHSGAAAARMQKLGTFSGLFATNITGMAHDYKKMFANPEAMKANVAAFKQQFNLANLIVGASLKIIEATATLVRSADKATTSLAAGTAVGREFNDVLIGAQRTGNLFGLSMDEAGKAILALNAGTTNFTQVGKATQMSLTTNVALLSKLGVSADQSAKMINTLNLSLGMNMEESMEATKSIALMGTELGITADQMTKDFDKAMSTLAVYGDKAPGIFKNIAGAAKAAGVEMGSLLNVAKKFDTFKDAAETVGMMNALLGTSLSTTEMLMKTEDERIETLIGTVQAQGRAFKDMGRFEQKAIASAAGITDMNEAAKIFGMNLSKFKDYQNQMDENADTQEKFKDAIDATIPIATKIMAIFTELGIFVMPILESIHWALDGIKWVLNEMNPAFKTFLKIATMIGAGVVMFWKLKAVFLSIWGVLAPIGTAIAGVAGAVNPIVWAIMGVVIAVGALWAMFRSGDKEVDNLTNKLNKLDDVNVKASANVNTVRRDNTTRVQGQGQSMRQNQTQSAVNSNTIVQQGGLQPGQPVIISLDQDGMSQITAKIKSDGREAAADLMWGQ